jgi:hypothetical protein
VILFVFIFAVKQLMAHVAAHSKMEIEELLVNVFCVLSGEGDVFNFEGWHLFLHECEAFLLFWIIFYH